MTERVNTGVRARRKAERPGEILEAALEEFVQRGYEATRLEDIAARAGVTKGTVYNYFRSKEEVFAAMVRHLGQHLHEQFKSFLDDNADPTAGTIRDDLKMLYTFVANDRRGRELLRLLISEAVRFPELVDEHFQIFISPLFEKLGERLRLGIASGTFRATPAVAVPELLIGPALVLNVWMMLFSDRKPIDAEKHFEAAVDLILYGLVRPGEGAS